MRVRILNTRQAPSVFQRLWPQRGQAPEVIRRAERPYWQERGWVRQGNRYTGNYQTRYGSFKGTIDQMGTNSFQFFIFDPPPEMKRHSHWACFQARGGNGYQVH